MKKIIFSALLFLLHLTLWAQTEKGRWTAGVSIGSFTYQSQEAGHSFSASLSPSLGHFVAKNLLVGVGIPLSLSSSKYSFSPDSYSNKNTTLGLSPFIRYYVGNSPLKPLVGLALTYEHFNLRQDRSPNVVSITKGNTLQITPSIGLAYFINRSIAVDAKLGYNWSTSKATGSDTIGTVYNNDAAAYTTKNASLILGFSIFFGE